MSKQQHLVLATAVLFFLLCTSAVAQEAILLDGALTPDGATSRQIAKDKEYFTVSVRTMRLNKTRRGFSRYYATVYGQFEFLHKGEETEFATVTDPSKFGEIDARNVDRIAHFNQRLFGPIPYKGGLIGVDIGLFAIKSADLAEPYMNLLAEVSKDTLVPSIAAALPFANIIRNGIDTFAGGKYDSVLEVGYKSEWEQPRTGYYVIFREKNDKYPKQVLKIIDAGVPGDVVLAERSGRELMDISYTIVSVTASERHDYWTLLPEIKDTYLEMYKQLAQDKEAEARETLVSFRRAVMTSWELQQEHKTAIVEAVKRDFEQAVAEATLGPVGVRPLEEYWPTQ
jgi:hypothetical protein